MDGRNAAGDKYVSGHGEGGGWKVNYELWIDADKYEVGV